MTPELDRTVVERGRGWGWRWPWQPREERSVYVDALLAQIVKITGADAGAAGKPFEEAGALEIAAALYARAFAQARTTGVDVPPDTLAALARDLVVGGESVWLARGVSLVRAAHWTIHGKGADPDHWWYRLRLPAPDSEDHVVVDRARVAHPKWSSDPSIPWRGVGPRERARNLMQMLGGVERSLAGELPIGVRYVLPTAQDPNSENMRRFQEDLKSGENTVLLTETLQQGWGDSSRAPANEYVPQRVGPAPPDPVIHARAAAQISMLAVCGVPPEMVLGSTEGTGAREAWRRFLHGGVQPLGRVVARELSRALRTQVELDFDALMASDIQGRARAFQSLVQGGMEPGRAAAVSGMLEGDGT